MRRNNRDIWRIRPYKVKSINFNIYAGYDIVLLNEREAQEHDIFPGYREIIKVDGKEKVVIVDVAGDDIIKPGYIGIFKDLQDDLNIKDGEIVQIIHMNRPPSLTYIRKKLDGDELSEKEIEVIIDDLMNNRLNEGELGAWIAAMYINKLTNREVVGLTKAIVKSGDTLNLNKRPIADKHCIGGVAGNRTTMILVPIVAAAGVYIPKTSSRAITSPAGTADTMEVLAKVDFKLDYLKKMVLKTKGCMVWGGGLNLASADDKLIKIRKPLKLDPKGVLLASILAKKKSVGANYVVVDIPIGMGAKIEDINEAKVLAKDFINIGKMLGMKIEVLITDGSEPIGKGIGPALEARDVLRVLEGNGPKDLRDKGVLLAGKILELVGKAKKGKGIEMAERILKSGKALKKMKEIIEYQGGDPNITSSKIKLGKFKYDVISNVSGKINHIDNKKISQIARIAGSPLDKRAGIYLHVSKGMEIKKGEKLYTIYAESKEKLVYAIEASKKINPIELQKILLGTIR